MASERCKMKIIEQENKLLDGKYVGYLPSHLIGETA
jgi:hypothetical protein